MAKKIAVCKKCGKQYPRWRLEREGVCEAVVSAKNGLKRCCGSIIEATDPKRMNAYVRKLKTIIGAILVEPD